MKNILGFCIDYVLYLWKGGIKYWAWLGFLWIFVFARHAGLSTMDHLVIMVFCVFWLRYSLRVIRITREYDDMPPGADRPGTRRHWGRRR